ncbi:glycosyltransferase involved in cell wall biosynthesis/ADP-heptose:LPS heptosyltransferase [Sphingomonas sp. UYEF23]
MKAMIRRGTEHEFIVVLNGQFSEGIEAIRADLSDYLPQSKIRVWQSPGPFPYFDDGSHDRRKLAEVMREHYLRSLEPDVVLVTSLFEGLGDSAVISVKKSTPEIPIACIFYDLTPLIMPDEHFETSPLHRRWYRDRIANLKKCDLLLAISESSRGEAVDELDFEPNDVVNIFGAQDQCFVFKNFSEIERRAVRRRFGFEKPFILYAGGLELNKNLRRLIEGLSYLPANVREQYQFVCVGKRNAGESEKILSLAQDPQVRNMISVVGHVSETDLVDLYNACELFAFPSLREGFGLPALEAMACGAPTIVSNTTSLPEVVGNAEATFDPTSPKAIGDKIYQVIANPDFRARLVKSGLDRAAMLTWDLCAKKTLDALDRFKVARLTDANRRATVLDTAIFKKQKLSILVFKLDHHGDFFIGLPAMAKLRARYPDARIDIVVGSWNKNAALASELFNEVFTLDYFKSKSSDRPLLHDEHMDFLGRTRYYDYAIDLRRQPDTRFILFKAKAERYFGYKTGNGNLDSLLTNGLDIHSDAAGQRGYFDAVHASEQTIRILDALPFDVNDYIRLPAMGKRLTQKKGAVAIFPRVGLDARQWDSDRFGALMRVLAASPAVSEINVYAGKLEELDPIGVPKHRKINIRCGFAFADLYTSLSANEICVGNNSFGVHVASYAGCRTIGIYSGHELPQQWGPAFNKAQAIMIDAACAPCHLPDRQSCPFGVFCLEDISVKAVSDLVLADIAGVEQTAYRSDIIAANPASAVPALIEAINQLRVRDTIGNLPGEQKVAVAAAISRNFPERKRSGFTLYIDVSNFRHDVNILEPKTQIQWDTTVSLIRVFKQSLPVGYSVETIASRQHDHEFYLVPFDRIEDVSASSEDAPVVVPIPGDIYLGVDLYPYRNSAQWDLVYSWRTSGVTTAFLMSRTDLGPGAIADPEEPRARLMEAFLREAMHFDHILLHGPRPDEIEEWVQFNVPPRERPISITDVSASSGVATGLDPDAAPSTSQFSYDVPRIIQTLISRDLALPPRSVLQHAPQTVR